MEKLLHGVGPIQVSGFIVILGDTLEGAAVHENVIAKVFPQQHNGHAQKRPLAAGEPAGQRLLGDAQDHQQHVDGPAAFVEQGLPDRGDRHHVGDVGQEEQRPGAALAVDGPVHHIGQHRREE